MTTQDMIWLNRIIIDYFTAISCHRKSDIAIAKERFDHGIESLAQREYHRGFEDGMRVAGKES